ncbi:DUF6233 domain-containing protein [Streptomyces rubiginosohelvolus]|uniref:DUF6233 domain-containing protein n=1 Tax=Streptomyces rubiginosohelvolus TaxID=67362 RepID=UPI0035DED898
MCRPIWSACALWRPGCSSPWPWSGSRSRCWNSPPGPARTPDWGIAEAGTGVGTPDAEVHRGDCWAQGRTLRPVSAERARAELAGGMRACAVCRPDRVLNRP